MKTATRSLFPLLALAATLALPLGVLGEDPKPSSDAKPPAGGPRRPDGPGGDRVAAMQEQRESVMKELGLSDDQMSKLREINKGQVEKMRALRADTSLSQEDRRAKMSEMRESANAQMKKILTEEQYTKYQKLMDERRQQRGGGPGGEGRRPRGEGKPEGKPDSKPAPAPAQK